MQKLVECVPNFSEGKDQAVLDAIAEEIRGVEGATLLDVDPGAATNRTVFTFVGSPEAVEEAAVRAIRKGSELIDMRGHHGEHPRMGAADVCPFVPVSGVTMEECVEIARRVGERVGRELGIPVFLYGKAASRPERDSATSVRVGEYEGLAERFKDPDWAPDFGPNEFNPRAGATAVGVRDFLLAYNVNLNTRNRKLATQIAFGLRETGRVKRDEKGNIALDKDGNKLREPGRFRKVQAAGWIIEEYGCAQVTINILDLNLAPIHEVFDAACEEATALGVRITGSELVGLIPLRAMTAAGRHYLQKQGMSTGVPESELVRTAIRSMGLSEFYPFDADKKIIEYAIRDTRGSLVEMTVRGFADELSTDSPAPGGGSVAALCGALGGALGAMVPNLTVGKKGLEENWDAMCDAAPKGQELKDWFLHAVDEDTAAFNRVMDCMRLPKKTDEEKAARDAAIQDATREATLVPFRVLERSLEVLDLAGESVNKGNPNSMSDAGVAALCAQTCAEGAYLNVVINLGGITDKAWAAETRRKAEELRSRAVERSRALLQDVEAKLKPEK